MQVKFKLKVDSKDKEFSNLVKELSFVLEDKKGRNKDALAIQNLENRFEGAFKAKNKEVLKALLREAKNL